MNAERLLVAPDEEWRIPPYARDMLWVSTGGQIAQVMGERGQFALDVQADNAPLILRWGRQDGPALACWLPDEMIAPDVVGWAGDVAVGGFVERLHVLTVRGLDLMIAEVEGGALPADYPQLPDLDEMRESVFQRASEPTLVGERHVYPVIVLAETLLAESLQQALITELSVDCWGLLGPQEGGWHDLVGLPILGEAVTLLAPRRR